MKKWGIIRNSNQRGWREVKRLILKTKITYQIKKKNPQFLPMKINTDISSFCKARKGKLGKSERLCEIELVNTIKVNKKAVLGP